MTNDVHELVPKTVALVRQWLETAENIPVPSAAAQLAGMLKDEDGLEFVVGFVDEVVRPEDLAVAAHNLARIGKNPPSFLGWHLKLAVRAGALLAPAAPKIVIPIARKVLRQMVGHLIVDATDSKLGKAITQLRKQQVSLNLNLLGEAVLGEAEATRRLEGTKKLLARDDVDYVSIKVSATVAPQQRWGFEETVADVVERLRPLYQIAVSSPRTKFINLDMEEYKDLALTMEVFTRLLSEPEFTNLRVGIVLQAYLPDAMSAMVRLQEWAAERVANGGAPIKVRLVKGANLPMELVEAELHHWPVATCESKQASDTNYKRVMNYALRPEHIKNVNLGVAGHNLFDLAFAWLLANKRNCTNGLDFEMLVGMAPGQAEAVRRTVGELLLYVPVVHPKEFDVAIAYLIRRLEEGANSENFMSAVFELAKDEKLFQREKERFLASLEQLDDEIPQPNRVQSRLTEVPTSSHDSFEPTADSDPAVLDNQQWAQEIRTQLADTKLGQDLADQAWLHTEKQLEECITTAVNSSWSSLSAAERAELLHRAGDQLAKNRGDLMVVAGAECGKTLDQSDPEVSEAVDFAHYYAESARQLAEIDGAEHQNVKATVVTPPWNFPLAIPVGSTLAALAAGSPVILKPSPNAARCSALLAKSLWDAGIPKDALQYVQVEESTLGSKLISDSRVDRVILTGGYDTAKLFKKLHPELTLMAETSGKNSIIVTPSADLDLAVKDVLASAFGHAGQKCSAASLVVLVGQVAKSRRFRDQLLDGVRSLKVGWPEDARTEVGPIIAPAEGKLLRGLTKLEAGQRWLAKPEKLDEEGKLWRPGIRGGVNPGSEYHQVEYFGPILGVMTANTLEEAIEIVNGVDYGLTSGLHSLDPAEMELWMERIHAGNLYINRGITGAIVQRQPFGGWKRSVVGPTTKAGGPNYLIGLSQWKPKPSTAATKPLQEKVVELVELAKELLDSDEAASIARAAASDQQAWDDEFSVARDVQGLSCERNIFRYRQFLEPITIRLSADGRIADLMRVVAAAIRAGKRPIVSVPDALPGQLRTFLVSLGIDIKTMNDTKFADSLTDIAPGRIRVIGSFADYPARADLAIYTNPVTESGRIEQLMFYSEQAVSITAHRFGTPAEFIRNLRLV